ncbi:MAG: hypothetical protein EOP04_02970 [Proteobacteria bacterium]|nr:MAG: hypothetical protein EOP04_02970 [Pseudomonadota bacterium]
MSRQHPSRWSVVILNQDASRAHTDPKQPLDQTKVTRRFIVLSSQDMRPVFNCIECVSSKGHVAYPDVEISADGRLFTNDSLARPGMIYTLQKDDIRMILGPLTDRVVMQKITTGIHVFIPS